MMGRNFNQMRISFVFFSLVVALLGELSCAQFLNDDSVILSKISGNVTEKSESAKAFEMFTILLGDEGEEGLGVFGHEKHVVFRDGLVEDHWQPPVGGTTTSEDGSNSLFYHGAYADRITFDFFFGAFPDYDITKPECLSSANNVAQPKVIDFQIDEEENSGSFTIVYDCQKHADSDRLRNTTIFVTFPVATGMSVRFAFQKTCGGGVHKYIEFGYYAASENEDAGVSRVTFGSSETSTMSVGPHVSSTRVFLLLHGPAESQEFFHVSPKSEGEGLLISVQGPVFGGVLRRGRPTMLYVVYDCRRDGKHKVSLTVPLRPFDDLKGTWEKDCGGGVAEGLSIGTSSLNHNDIVNSGVTDDEWLMALTATSGRIGENAPVVNISTRVQDLWISNDGIPLQIAPEVITVEKPDMLTVYGSRSIMRASGLQDKDGGGLIPSSSKMRLRLRMICKKKGRSLVLVTLPIKSFKKIDLGFVKECRAPRQFRHSGFLRTANSAMIAVSLILMTGLLMCLRLRPGEQKASSLSHISQTTVTDEIRKIERSLMSGRRNTKGHPGTTMNSHNKDISV